MKEKYTYKEIAKLSGVAVGTVSRYFNNYQISDSAKAKIKIVVDKLNYVPNFAAASIKKKNKDIFFIIPFNIQEEANILIANGAASFLDGKGYNLFISYVPANSDDYLQYLQTFINRNPAGIIMLLPKLTSDKLIKFIKDIKTTSIVVYNREIENIMSVNISDFELINEVTTEILKNNKKVAYIGLNDGDPTTGKLRTEGFKKAVEHSKIQNSITLLEENSVEMTNEILPKLYKEGYRSFVCATNTISFAVQKYLIDNNLRSDCLVTDIGYNTKTVQINKPDYYVFIDYYLIGIKLVRKLINIDNSIHSEDHKILNFIS